MVTTRGSARQKAAASAEAPKKSKAAPKKTAGKKRDNPEEAAAAGAIEQDQPPVEKKTKAEEVQNGGKPDGKKHATVGGETDIEGEKAAKEKEESKDVEMSDANQTDNAVKTDSSREKKAEEESPIAEKGLVYFFLRSKVNVEHPESLAEVKRAYMVLRPQPQGTKLVDGKVEDAGHNRLIAIPKKRMPVRGSDRLLAFVQEPKASLKDIREKHLNGRTYQTKTLGERTDYPAQPVAEGVYAITKSEHDRQSHFAYMLTIPEMPGELQEELGLKKKGSFIVSVRNPANPAPANVGIPEPADYPKGIMDEFEGLKWGPVMPHHLDYQNAEVLFIGEKHFPDSGGYQETGDELAQLEDEDEKRVKHLDGSESVFADLELSKKGFLGVQTTWG